MSKKKNENGFPKGSDFPEENAAAPAAGYREPSRRENLKLSLRLFGSIRVLCLAAFFCALSFVLAWIAKTIFGPGALRLTFENLPIILGGILFGPIIGAVIGTGADILSCVSAGMSLNPLITVGAASVGFVAGICAYFIFPSVRTHADRAGYFRLLFCELPAQLIGSVILKSVALYLWGNPIALLIWRLPIYLGVTLIESYLLFVLLKNKSIQREIERMR